MKKTTCKDLRGACDAVILGDTPREMSEHSKQHIMEMVQSGDAAHKTAIQDMMNLSPEAQLSWYSDFERHFESLPEAD